MPPVTPSAIRAIGNYSRSGSDYSSILTTLRRRISFCAMAIFLSPSSRGTEPFSSCRARLPAKTTNSNRFSLGGRSTMSFQADLKVRRSVHVSTSRRACRGGPSGPPSFECRDDVFGRLLHHLHAGALGQHNRPQPFHGCIELVVDDDVLVSREFAHLTAGHVEPFANGLLRILAAATQALFEDLRGRRQHED